MTPTSLPRSRWFVGAAVALAACAAIDFRTPTRVEAADKSDTLDAQFATKVKPFIDAYCVSCHGPKKKSASLDSPATRPLGRS